MRIYRQMKLTRWLDDYFLEGIILGLKNGFDGKAVNIC